MAAEQFNVRLRDRLGYGVRVYAASLGDGTKPRDVIEQALLAAGFSPDGSIDAVRLPTTDGAHRPDDGHRPEGDDQRAPDAATPRRKRRKDAVDTAGEAGKSGQGRRGVPADATTNRVGGRRSAASETATVSGGSPPEGGSPSGPVESPTRGCPECGGALEPHPNRRPDDDWMVCVDCRAVVES